MGVIKIEIIEAQMCHFDAVYDLLCVLENEIMNKSKMAQIYAQNMEDSTVFYFSAVQDGVVIGFASMHIQHLLHHAAPMAELQEIVVREGSRGQGVGRLLFQKAQQTALKENCMQLEVCCNQVRTESHAFYLRQGMKNSHYKFTATLAGNFEK